MKKNTQQQHQQHTQQQQQQQQQQLTKNESNNIVQSNQRVASFLKGLYKILQQESPSIIKWVDDGTGFQIMNIEKLASDIIPKYFRQKKFASFQRQLNYFGFKKVTKVNAPVYTYKCQYFSRDKPHEFYKIRRNVSARKTKLNGISSTGSSMSYLETSSNSSSISSSLSSASFSSIAIHLKEKEKQKEKEETLLNGERKDDIKISKEQKKEIKLNKPTQKEEKLTYFQNMDNVLSGIDDILPSIFEDIDFDKDFQFLNSLTNDSYFSAPDFSLCDRKILL